MLPQSGSGMMNYVRASFICRVVHETSPSCTRRTRTLSVHSHPPSSKHTSLPAATLKDSNSVNLKMTLLIDFGSNAEGFGSVLWY